MFWLTITDDATVFVSFLQIHSRRLSFAIILLKMGDGCVVNYFLLIYLFILLLLFQKGLVSLTFAVVVVVVVVVVVISFSCCHSDLL